MGSNFKSGKFSRFAKLGSTLVKAGGQVALDLAKDRAQNLINKSEKAQSYQHRINAAKEIIKTMGELKGAMMKLGQMISITEDLLLPPEISALFKELQKNSPSMTREDLLKVFHDNFEKTPEELFQQFDYDSIAAASIGQVHRAVLPTGEVVAIKVQYPEIVTAIKNDFKNLDQLNVLLSSLIPGRPDIGNMVEELKRSLLEECDYHKEAEYLELFRTGLAQEFPDLYIPKVYPEFSTENILTMEFRAGEPIEKAINFSQEERNHLGQLLYDSHLYALYKLKRIHSDPQNGNYLFQKGAVTLLDFGSTRAFSDEFMIDFVAMILALEQDHYQIYTELMQKMDFFRDDDEVELKERHFELVKKLYLPFCRPGKYYPETDNPFSMVGDFIKGIRFKGRKAPREEFLLLDRAHLGLFTKVRHLRAEVDWQKNSIIYRKHWEELALEKYPDLENVDLSK
ncbi:MAG: AarF/ABC1/UbiB kinase family protein [Halobacteriovoraceae bacterium]|jgi:aarF domain-containing kinase|nr:AarF/ABC1/UbiB kinase family protein [Halobacteriovoraceae bacterium]MBT5094165.1 AarF/ABC1/UbiB kinase family protein [Halobacteriovoraceae bacterium]